MRRSVTLGGPLGIRVPEKPRQVWCVWQGLSYRPFAWGFAAVPCRADSHSRSPWGAGRLILAFAFQTFSSGPADAFRKEITNSIVLKNWKKWQFWLLILALLPTDWEYQLLASFQTQSKIKFNWTPPMVKRGLKMCFLQRVLLSLFISKDSCSSDFPEDPAGLRGRLGIKWALCISFPWLL